MSTPYEILQVSGGWEFITDRGYKYLVYFRKDEGLFEGRVPFSDQVFTFGFENRSQTNKRLESDPRIQPTIILIVEKFFLAFTSAIMFWFCADLDGKHLGRHKLYQRWYANGLNAHYHKIDAVLPYAERNLPISFMLLRSHPGQAEIEKEVKILVFEAERGVK